MADASSWVSVSAPYLRPRPPGEPDAWAEEAAQHERIGTQRLREVAEIVPPRRVTEDLGIPAGESVIVRRRTVLLDEHPVELVDSYYPAALARGTGLAKPSKIRGGAITLLAELGHRPLQVQEDVCAREPTREERELLRLDEREWVLVLSRTLLDDKGVPVEMSVMTMIARGRHLRYRLAI
jgi:GntR family transcriptional regulator